MFVREDTRQQDLTVSQMLRAEHIENLIRSYAHVSGGFHEQAREGYVNPSCAQKLHQMVSSK